MSISVDKHEAKDIVYGRGGLANHRTPNKKFLSTIYDICIRNGMVPGHTQTLLQLEDHHVVLGRYNGTKSRSLTPATQIYRCARQGIRRTNQLSDEEVQAIKDDVTNLLRKEMGQSDIPQVEFCVDISKAGNTASHHNQLLYCFDQDRKVIVLVPDVNNFFLKIDVASKRHTGVNAANKIARKQGKVKRQGPPSVITIDSAATTRGSTSRCKRHRSATCAITWT